MPSTCCNPTTVSQVYIHTIITQVDNSLDHDRLQDLANKLQDFLLTEKIIAKKEYESVNLHMTLMNISFVRTDKHARHFDCSSVINECADWDFGLCSVNEIHLSQMHSSGVDSYYVNDASFPVGAKD